MLRQIIFLSAFFLFTMPAFAERVEVLNWQSLIPKSEPLVNPLNNLEISVRLDIEYLATVHYWFKTGQITKVSTEYEDGLELEHQLKDKKIDFEPLIAEYNEFLDEIERRNKTVVKELEGKMVKIPGFALPLETSDTAVNEFLLVPTVGACIHTPTPPSNQMVFVELKQSYKPKNLYDPVWVTGKMKIQSTKQSVVYSDGEAGIETAYILVGTQIEPYQEIIEIPPLPTN
ncbi:MAG: DUF3299 domain-containing protein [Alphaproteobacteria bacterium]|nr:DUF3299 domain-containing protein [Rhodospirillales bacterium]MCW9045285.1 DUF3299 domain-containing protein [Alphaproteobacteria bacterium]